MSKKNDRRPSDSPPACSASDTRQVLKWIETELYAGMVMLPKNDGDKVWNDAHQRCLGILKNYAHGEGLFQMTSQRTMKLKGCTGNALRNGTDSMTPTSLPQLNDEDQQ